MSAQLLRFADWTSPVPPVEREVLSALPEGAGDNPPLLFVPGLGTGRGRSPSTGWGTPRPGATRRTR